jgi:glycosyltransferase involved in cell wall biosynthesis
MRVAVVTPTIGSEYLRQCLNSVQNQDHPDVIHYVFIDGEEYKCKVQDAIFVERCDKKIAAITLDDNIGKGWYGHRVYSACSFLVNADIICYLDEDNWIDPNHVSSLVKTIMNGNAWAYSFRKIYRKNGEYACKDDCESLGKWPVYFNKNVFHIDTSCFAIRRDVAVQIGHAWYAQWGADRQFFDAIKTHFPHYDCSHQYSLNYRLDGNQNSVTEEFFKKGNEENFKNYKGQFPWGINDK